MPHLHNKEFHVLQTVTLQEERMFSDLLHWDKGGGTGLRALGQQSYSCQFQMRFPEFRHALTLLLLQDCSPQLHGSPDPMEHWSALG